LLTLEDEESELWGARIVGADGRHTPLVHNLSLAYAQGVGEDYARKVGAGGLGNPRAQWRQREASDKQKWLLRKLHMDHEPAITAGAASDLLSAAQLRRVVREIGEVRP